MTALSHQVCDMLRSDFVELVIVEAQPPSATVGGASERELCGDLLVDI